MYKVGQKVRVRKDLDIYRRDGEPIYVFDMERMRGKEMTIRRIHGNSYLVNESPWWFTDEMLEPIYSIGDRVTHAQYGEGTVIRVVNDTGCIPYLCKFGDWSIWCMPDQITPIKEEPMYASQLMELARANPKEYEGKKYKVVSGSAMFTYNGQEFRECVVKSGMLLIPNSPHYGALIYSDTQLELIPVSVPAMDAVEAYSKGKTVQCKIGNYLDTTYSGGASLSDFRGTNGSYLTAKELTEGVWYILD